MEEDEESTVIAVKKEIQTTLKKIDSYLQKMSV